MMYEDLLVKVASSEEMLVHPIAPDKIETARIEFPGIPEDYLAFLREVGWGDITVMMLYSGPCEAGSVISYFKELLPNVILIGDDYQGYCLGFDSEAGHRLIEVAPDGTVEVLHHLHRRLRELNSTSTKTVGESQE